MISCTTHSIHVVVNSRFIQTDGKEHLPVFVFGYHITITNQGNENVQLLEREWFIRDACGVSRSVRGEGVVGMKPQLAPGETFSYSSYCPLPLPFGQMEGYYTFKAAEKTFRVVIPRFFMESPFHLN
ncbi:MAG: Co2+/Mg2+ efflux protein ApaG [Sphingomonadales bacterium]